MGTSERKEREKQEMSRLILKAAQKLFVEEGFEKVSIRRIAETIEYSVGTIYLYFKDKEEILLALHSEGFNELYRRQQTIAHIADPLERLRQHSYVYIYFGLENPDYYDLMFISQKQGQKIVEKREWVVGNRTYEFLEENIRDCLASGAINSHAASEASITFTMWAVVHGIVTLLNRRMALLCPVERQKELIDEAVNFFIQSLSTKSSAKE